MTTHLTNTDHRSDRRRYTGVDRLELRPFYDAECKLATIMCSSYTLLLGLLFSTTTMSSLGVRPSQDAAARHRRRPSLVDIARRTFDAVAASPSSRRLLTAPDRSSPSAVFRGELRNAETTPLDDEEQFPAAKRRWNSGNLRVWGKRSPSLPYIGDQLYGREGDENPAGGEPIWLLPATAIDGEQAPAAVAGEWTASRPHVGGTSWDEVAENGDSESTRRPNRRRTWNNVNWRA